MHMTLLHFAQSLGGCSLASLSHWGDAPSLRSVTRGCSLASLSHLGGRSLALLSHWGERSFTLLSHWGMLPCFAQLLGGRSLASLSQFPFNGSIKLLQNLHSRGSMKQHFYVWEPHCGYPHKVKMANGAINMHSRGSMLL